MNTDSDFIPEDSETDSEIETQSNIDAPIISEDDSFIDTLDEIDAIDVINTIYELFEEYHDTYILLTSTPKFYPDMVVCGRRTHLVCKVFVSIAAEFRNDGIEFLGIQSTRSGSVNACYNQIFHVDSQRIHVLFEFGFIL